MLIQNNTKELFSKEQLNRLVGLQIVFELVLKTDLIRVDHLQYLGQGIHREHLSRLIGFHQLLHVEHLQKVDLGQEKH